MLPKFHNLLVTLILVGSSHLGHADIQQLLLQADQEIEARTADETLATRAERSAAFQVQLDRLRELSRTGSYSDGSLLKASRLQELATNIQQRPDFAASSRLPTPVDLHFDPQAVGGSCETALPLVAGDARRVRMAAGGSLWFKVELTAPHGLRLSTRGSKLDAALSVWKDCRLSRQPAYAHGDDNFGLQAEVAIAKSEQSFWMVRLDNTSFQSGHATLSAVRAAVVQGTVLRDSNSTPVSLVRVAAFLVESSSPSYFTDIQTNLDGTYSIAMNGPATIALRTGNFGGVSDVLHQAFEGRACSSAYLFEILTCGIVGDNYTPIDLAEPDTRNINFRLLTAPTLSGRVTSSDDGLPLENAFITVYNAQGGSIGGTITDSSGRYQLSGFSPQSVFVSAGAQNHTTEIHDNIPCNMSFCDIAGATSIPLINSSNTRVDFELTRQQEVNIVLTVDGAVPPANIYGMAALLNSNGAIVYAAEVYDGRVRIGPVAPGEYRLRVLTGSTYPELYRDIECASDCLAELSLATPIVVTAKVVSTNVAMDLRGYPTLRGRITDENTGLPISGAYVRLIHPNGITTSRLSDQSGFYAFPSVATGNYFLHVSATGSVDELYDNIPCESDDPILDCPGGLLLNFHPAGSDRTIDVQLARAPSISGVIRTSSLHEIYVDLFLLAANGQVIRQYSLNTVSGGRYTINDIPPGTHRLGVRSYNFTPQLYSMIECASANSGSWSGCNLNAAEAIVVNNSVVTDIDFDLRRFGSRRFRVVSALTGEPLQGVSLDVWSTDFTRATTHLTDANGQANVGLSSYFNGAEQLIISTDNALGLIDQVFENISCPNGSAFFGACSLSGGTPLSFPALDNASPVVITLSDPRFIFSDGFEQ